jgi:SAM-dependent methyltransferase
MDDFTSPMATPPEDAAALVAENRRTWDAWAPHHAASEFYDVAGFKAGRETLDAVELDGVGDVRGKSLLHLQCHFGMDTLSWARHGARVTGVDFSEPAIATARELAADLDLDARFICCDVYDTLDHLDGERFDVVFTSDGAISWLPDLGPWARVIAGSLKPGGTFFVAESHPYLWMFDEDVADPGLVFRYPYFDRSVLAQTSTGSYAVPEAEVVTTQNSWQHTFEELIGALVAAGLRVTSLREYPYLYFSWFPWMVKGDDGQYRLPAGMPDLPLMFSLTATLDGPASA